jgi:hypothetical protein
MPHEWSRKIYAEHILMGDGRFDNIWFDPPHKLKPFLGGGSWRRPFRAEAPHPMVHFASTRGSAAIGCSGPGSATAERCTW